MLSDTGAFSDGIRRVFSIADMRGARSQGIADAGGLPRQATRLVPPPMNAGS